MNEKLAEFRTKIDAIDDELIRLLNQREKIVEQVGELKSKEIKSGSFIRPAREANMLRRIVSKNESNFPKAALAAIWRNIISGSLNIEQKLKISVFTPENNRDNLWLSREYFGSFSSYNQHSVTGRVISDLTSGAANVAVLPNPVENQDKWWQQLDATQREHQKSANKRNFKIFAILPFIRLAEKGGSSALSSSMPQGLAVAEIEPENTGDDTSLICLNLDSGVSRTRIANVFIKAGLNASILAPANLDSQNDGNNQASRTAQYLYSVEGFVDDNHPALEVFSNELGENLHSIRVLGAYANPLIVD